MPRVILLERKQESAGSQIAITISVVTFIICDMTCTVWCGESDVCEEFNQKKEKNSPACITAMCSTPLQGQSALQVIHPDHR